MNKLYSFVFAGAHHGFRQRGLSKAKPRDSANNSALSKLKRAHNASNVYFQRKSLADFSGEAESLQLSPMKQTQNDDDANGGMASKAQTCPRLPKKKTLEQQAVVDEILQVVADQGRRKSLSQTDYNVQKRIEFGLRRQKRLTSEGSSFDDSSSCASGSDLSTSPPPSRRSSISSFSDEGKVFEFSSRPRTLPPLNRSRTHRPFRPTPPKIDFDEERETNCASRLSRPMTARGQRSRPQRGFTL